MTLQEFKNKYNGKFIDYDGKFGNQCMDLYRQYVKEVWELPQTPSVISASMVFDTIDSSKFDKFTSGEMRVGDVVVWSEKFCKNGHIAVVENPSDPKSLVVFGQNDPIGAPCKLSRHTYANITGWFRPKQNNQLQKTFMRITVVGNKINWDYKKQLPIISEWFKRYSGDKFEPVFDFKDVSFDNIPLIDFQGKKAVDIDWYRANITPLATGQATVLLLNPDQYQQPGIWGYMTFADTNRPVRMEVACSNEIGDINFPEAHLVVHRIFHEICHALYFLADQKDISHADPTQPRVHELLFVPEPQLQVNRQILLNEIDYKKLQNKLVTIK